jgi:hypothetical protein
VICLPIQPKGMAGALGKKPVQPLTLSSDGGVCLMGGGVKRLLKKSFHFVFSSVAGDTEAGATVAGFVICDEEDGFVGLSNPGCLR